MKYALYEAVDTHEFKPYKSPKVEKQGTEAPWD